MPEIHLFHPMMVHFTIALVITGLLCELAWIFLKNDVFRETSKWNLTFAFVAALLTVITGLMAEDAVTMSPAAADVFETHETIGYLILGLVAILFVWRLLRNNIYYQKYSVLFAVLFVIAAIVVLIGAYFGGELVFSYGVGVKTAALAQ